MKSLDYFDIKAEEQEPLNVTVGRLRMAIQTGTQERQLELIERIAKNLIGRKIID